MYYEIIKDNQTIAIGLSKGELNQWLIDCCQELNGDSKESFKKSLTGKVLNDEEFEDYIYDNDLPLPKTFVFGNYIITIKEFNPFYN